MGVNDMSDKNPSEMSFTSPPSFFLSEFSRHAGSSFTPHSFTLPSTPRYPSHRRSRALRAEVSGRNEGLIYYPLVPYRFVWSSARLLPVSRHRLTVSLVGRREGTGLLTSLPSLCFGPSVHASGRQGQGPARFLVPLVNRGPVARRASSVGTAHSVHSPAPGGGRNERSEERAVILPSHHGPSPSLPAEPGQGSDRLSLISSVPSLRRVTSYPRPFLTCSTRLSTACLVSLRYARRTGT